MLDVGAYLSEFLSFTSASSELHAHVVVIGHLTLRAAIAHGVWVHHPLLSPGLATLSYRGRVHLPVRVRELELVFLKMEKK